MRRAASSLVAGLALCACAALAHAGEPEPRGYTLADFKSVQKIDAHVHLHGAADRFVQLAVRDNFRLLTLNVDYPDFPPPAEQQRAAQSLVQRYPGRVAFVATFSTEAFQRAGWLDSTLSQLHAALAGGAIGVKVWKNIGMSLQDPDGRFVMPDDPRFEPIFAMLEREHVVVLGHQAEPLNCWLPEDKMTVRSDRDYFREHPQYYMFRHPEMPAHDAILAARDRMLKAHPALLFDAVHLASLEWDVDRVAAFLDRFPTAHVDVAARMVHLQFQATRNRSKVRQFLIRYADRILYGSDDAYGPAESDPKALQEVDAEWRRDWRFLVTRNLMHSPDFDRPFRGLGLPRPVVDKIYRRNAESLFAGAWDKPPSGTPTAYRTASQGGIAARDPHLRRPFGAVADRG